MRTAVEAVVEGLIARLEADEQGRQGHATAAPAPVAGEVPAGVPQGEENVELLRLRNEAHDPGRQEGPAAGGSDKALGRAFDTNTDCNDGPVDEGDVPELSARPADDNRLKGDDEEARGEQVRKASTPSMLEAPRERNERAQQLELQQRQRRGDDHCVRRDFDDRALPASRSMSEEASAVLAKIAQRGRNRFGVGATDVREVAGDRGAARVLSSTDSLLEKYAQMQKEADQQKRVGEISR